MNWLDIAFLIILIVGAFAGLRIGFLGAGVVLGGFIVAVYAAGSVSNAIGYALEGFIDNGALRGAVVVLAYGALATVVLYAASVLVRAGRSMLSTATFGASNMADRAAGALLGLLLALGIVAAVTMVGARLVYQDDLDAIAEAEGTAYFPADALGDASAIEGLEGALTQSAIAPALADTALALPADALGLAPLEYQDALRLLEQQAGE